MEENYKILGLTSNSTLLEVKDAYFKSIKKYTPEKHGEMFIKLTNAYKELVNYYKSNEESSNKYQKIIQNMIDSEIKVNEKLVSDKFKECISKINSENFVVENDYILTAILTLKNNNYFAEALLLAYLTEMQYRSLGLEKLADSFIQLEHFIIK